MTDTTDMAADEPDDTSTVQTNGTRIDIAGKALDAVVDIAAVGGITVAALNDVATQTVVVGLVSVAGAKKVGDYFRNGK